MAQPSATPPPPPSPDRSGAAGADSARLTLRNSREEIEHAEESLLNAMARNGYPEASRFAIRLALEEAIVNAFRHGHKALPNEPVKFEYAVNPQSVSLAVEDQGPGFNPEVVPDPTLDENLELPTGRGLLLMRAYMARVEYVGRGNRVEMEYRRPAG